jgi:hypothetical protein
MEWYWWVLIAVGALFALNAVAARAGRRRSGDAFDAIRAAARRNVAMGAAEKPPPLRAELKPYVTRLCRVHATVGSFAAPETRSVGQEIFDRFGHQGMLSVHEGVRRALGPGPARDLEYKWDRIGEWLG